MGIHYGKARRGLQTEGVKSAREGIGSDPVCSLRFTLLTPNARCAVLSPLAS